MSDPSQDDLSPMLPQHTDDNAPMISGRGTKVIADARGAYLAGNLRALTEMMTPTQFERYRTIMLDQAASVIRVLLVELGLTDPSAHPSLQALDTLMTSRDQAQTVRALNCFFEKDREPDVLAAAQTSRVSEDLLQAVSSVVVPFVTIVRSSIPVSLESAMWMLATSAGQKLRERGYRTDHWWAAENIAPQQIHSNVQRWLIETAWAILLGKAEPSFDDLSQFGSISMLG